MAHEKYEHLDGTAPWGGTKTRIARYDSIVRMKQWCWGDWQPAHGRDACLRDMLLAPVLPELMPVIPSTGDALESAGGLSADQIRDYYRRHRSSVRPWGFDPDAPKVVALYERAAEAAIREAQSMAV